jgi:tetratricopeptide (TPR) repeat protein
MLLQSSSRAPLEDTHRRGGPLSLCRAPSLHPNGDARGKRRTIHLRGEQIEPVLGIDGGAGRTIIRAMAAVAPLYELPPLTALSLVRDDAADTLTRAEALVAENRHDEAVVALEELWDNVRSDHALALRHRLALSWSHMYRGELGEACRLLEHAAGLAQSPKFDAADRAEVLYRQGAVECQRSNVAEAVNLLTRALDMNERAPRPRARVASGALEWRSRCYQVRRDWDAAARDAEQSLEHATRAADDELQARALFQASIVAERRGDWLIARLNAEQALEIFRRGRNTLATARILNNLGGIHFLLGDAEAAESHLLAAIEAADAAGSEADLAQAVSSLAQVYLRTGRPADARVRAERAAELLANRVDFLDELGNAQLVVSRALMAEGETDRAAEWVAAAERSFDAFGSASLRANALIARGDLVRMCGDSDAAADLYRRAAESLQDAHF